MRNDKLITVMSPLTLPVMSPLTLPRLPGGPEPPGLWLSHLPGAEGRGGSLWV